MDNQTGNGKPIKARKIENRHETKQVYFILFYLVYYYYFFQVSKRVETKIG